MHLRKALIVLVRLQSRRRQLSSLGDARVNVRRQSLLQGSSVPLLDQVSSGDLRLLSAKLYMHCSAARLHKACGHCQSWHRQLGFHQPGPAAGKAALAKQGLCFVYFHTASAAWVTAWQHCQLHSSAWGQPRLLHLWTDTGSLLDAYV